MYRERLLKLRKEPVVVRLKKPTNIPRARELGYKAKQGIVVGRIRIRRGSGTKPYIRKGRRPSRMGLRKIKRQKSIQLIAEQRIAKKFPNLEVLNSYLLAEDGQHKWFEVIMVDPVILPDHPIASQTRRVFRGLTSAGKEVRGLHHRGLGAEKARPSKKAILRRRNKQ